MHQELDLKAVNMFKGLVIDAVHKAQSGHPGGPMSSMDLGYVLFKDFLQFDPQDPKWMGRDRFILSAGHMSMLQYALLFGVGWLTLDDLKAFRQWHSKTPGHPENFATPGVECTTGPLGQGCAMSVGFAIAAKHHQAALCKDLFQQKTWVICSDGDLQECVALGSASLAGHLGLDNLIWIYDKNDVQLSGPTKKVISDDDRKVFEGFGWHVITIDGHNHSQIAKAYQEASQTIGRPTIIIARTVIGKGCATMEDSFKTHGSPLPGEERRKTRDRLGLPADSDFHVDPQLIAHFQKRWKNLSQSAQTWKNTLATKLKDHAFAASWDMRFGTLKPTMMPPIPWNRQEALATRNAFGDIIKHWAPTLPALMGGSADLEPSNMTGGFAKAVGDFDRESRQGRNLNFGVREFPMSALCNGMALFGGIVPFDATFLSFADYSRPALRLGALQKVRVIHEFTHDSFYLGEDGPTHQPIEQLMSLRAIPDFYVMRPADPQETEVLMRHAVGLRYPSAFCLTRQKVPYLDLPTATVDQAVRGAYVVWQSPALENDASFKPDALILATGSEVSLAIAAAQGLGNQGSQGSAIKLRVISMPCWELFLEQDKAYQDKILPPSVLRRISLEAGVTLGWSRFVGLSGLTLGIDHFGTSAPAEKLAEEYGFTPQAVMAQIKSYLERFHHA